MKKLVFLGGVLAGAAGLAAVALHDQKRSEGETLPKDPANLAPVEIARLLNLFYLAAQNIYNRCNNLALECGDLISTPIDLPDDSFLRKTANLAAGAGNVFLRKRKASQAEDELKAAWALCLRNDPVFDRANAILREHGLQEADLAFISKPPKLPLVDSSLENDDWWPQMDACLDAVRDYLDDACAQAEDLIQALEKLDGSAPETAEINQA